MHADVLITIVFGGFAALVALVAGLAILRARLRARARAPTDVPAAR